MPCIKHSHTKAGLTLVEVMIALSIFGLLSAAIWTNVLMHGRSFIYNRASNANVTEASFVVNRLVYGGSNYWGLRIASRSACTVAATGVTGSDGQIGWQADVRHSVDDTYQPDILSDHQQLITYDPVAETVDVDGTVVGEGVTDSYFRIEDGNILLGIQIERLPQGRVSLMETRIKMRNF
jgi:prepilin-type N-terminal cleavage/methylation domain-containing protein